MNNIAIAAGIMCSLSYLIGLWVGKNKLKTPSIKNVQCQDCKYWVCNFNGCSHNPGIAPWYATDSCSYGERSK